MERFLLIVTALFLNLSGAILGKYIATEESIAVLIGLVVLLGAAYAGRVVFWIIAGKRYQLSWLYPVLSLNYLLSFGAGMLLFHEPFSLQRLIGAFIILAGVTVVSLSDNRFTEHRS